MLLFRIALSSALFVACVSGFGRPPGVSPPLPAPTLLPPYAPAPRGSVVSVLSFGAVGDGVADNTAAFNAAIAALGDGGGVVSVPSGAFAFDGALALPPGVALVGTYVAAPNHDLRRSKGVLDVDGSQLWLRGGRGNAMAPPFLSLGASASVAGFTIFYPQQNGSAAPEPFPCSVALLDRDAAAERLELLNSWCGIRVYNAPRFFIGRVTGQPVSVGIDVDMVADIGRIESVHFNPWFSDAPAWVETQLRDGVAFRFARTDWQYATNLFAFGYAIAYHFVESANGVANGQFLGAGADGIANASVQVDALKQWGVVFVNAELVAKVPWGASSADLAQIVVSASNNGTVRFSNSVFWGKSYAIARLAGTGVTSFDGCVFHEWDAAATGRAAIEASQGVLSVTASEFHHFHPPTSPQLRLDRGVAKALFAHNVVAGKLVVVDKASNVTAVSLIKDNLPDEE